MMVKLLKKLHRKLRRTFKQGWRVMHRRPALALLVVIVLISGSIIYMQNQRGPTMVDPSAYTPLLNTIAQGESNGNYNAHYGKADNESVRFTDMTIEQVLQWQEEFVRQGSPSSAVGKYQIIRPTLLKLVQSLKLDPTQTRFDPATQDRLAIALIEKRGAIDYVENKLTREQFAANLSQEWAALPKVIGENPNDSYYAGDGLNHARISIDQILAALNDFSVLAARP